MIVRRFVASVFAATLLVAACRSADSLAALAAAERERERAVAAARGTLEEMVFFDYDMSEIRSDAAATLRAKVGILRASPQVQIRIEGHADERGSTEYNLALGNRRAEAVRQFLAGFGLDASRFAIVSYGEERPLVRASNEEAWTRNRRAQFQITAGANAINPAN
jgi:peptidoglycan-associated lipoprotein